MATLFTINLMGEQEAPPTGSQASGQGAVAWDPAAQTAAYGFTIRGLDFGPITGAGETTSSTADNVTSAHFHNAPPGVAGPVVFGQIAPAQDADDLAIVRNADSMVQNADGSWTVSGVWDLSDPANVPISAFAEQLTAAQPGEDVALYWNVHTTAFPAGEIRGQLVADVAGFDRAFYLAENPDVAAAGVDPLRHYLTFGIQEGRQAFPVGSGDTTSDDDGDDGTLASDDGGDGTLASDDGDDGTLASDDGGDGTLASDDGGDGILASDDGGDGTLASSGAPTSVNDLSPFG